MGTLDGSGTSPREPGSQMTVGWLTAANSVGTNMASVALVKISSGLGHALDDALGVELGGERPEADDERLEAVALRLQTSNGQLRRLQLRERVSRQCHVGEFKAPSGGQVPAEKPTVPLVPVRLSACQAQGGHDVATMTPVDGRTRTAPPRDLTVPGRLWPR